MSKRKSIGLIDSQPLFDIKVHPGQDRLEWERQYNEQESKVLLPKLEGAGVFNLSKMRSHMQHSNKQRVRLPPVVHA